MGSGIVIAGIQVSTDEIDSFHHQHNKIRFGVDGTAIDVSALNPLPTSITFADSPSVDAFGRLRVSELSTFFDSKQILGNLPLIWDEAATGGASASTHSIPRASSLMTLGTTSGEKIIRQTKRYFNYQPGKSMLCELTAVMQPKVNVRQRVGYFDDDNGLFFEHDGVTGKVVVRSSVSGSPVDDPFDQADWNLDKMDGNGPSGITLDFSKLQIYEIDFQWFGGGRVRYSLSIGGHLHEIHEQKYSNILDSVYMSTPDLPVRYEIENTGTAATGTTLEHICSTVSSEGGYDPNGVVRGHLMENGEEASFNTTWTPVLSFRLSSAGIRASVAPTEVNLMLLSNAISIFRVLLNPTIGAGTSPTWDPVDSDSVVEVDRLRAGTVTGGTQVGGDYISTDQKTHSSVLPSDLRMAADIAGVSDEIVICCQRAGGGGAANVLAGMSWHEIS